MEKDTFRGASLTPADASNKITDKERSKLPDVLNTWNNTHEYTPENTLEPTTTNQPKTRYWVPTSAPWYPWVPHHRRFGIADGSRNCKIQPQLVSRGGGRRGAPWMYVPEAGSYLVGVLADSADQARHVTPESRERVESLRLQPVCLRLA